MATDTTLESVLNHYLRGKLSEIFTSIPAEVVSVEHLNESRIHAKILVDEIFSDYDIKEYPPIFSIPLLFPSSSSSAFTFPLNIGDSVLLVFSQRCLDVFKSGDGTNQPPNTLRILDKRDAIAIPCVWPFGKSKNTQEARTLPHSVLDCVVTHNLGLPTECEVRLKPTGKVEITSPLQVDIKSPSVNVITTAANITSLGAVNVASALATNLIATAAVNITSGGATTITAPSIALVGAGTLNGSPIATT